MIYLKEPSGSFLFTNQQPRFMKTITDDIVFEKLLDFGLFPEKIEKIFTSKSFGEWIRKDGLNIYKTRSFSNITFRLTRNNNAPRILNIPHPIPYFYLCQQIKENWTDIYKNIGEYDDYSRKSLIIPSPNNLNHRLVSMLSYDRNKDDKFLVLDKSFNAKYLVEVDIANYYPSIYSHSIAWALVGKKESKKNKDSDDVWYNKLDTSVRSLQRNETNGIPIGPDTSVIISEIILSQVDIDLIMYDYFRYIDDFKCYCKSKEDAESFLKDLSSLLEQYNLRINSKKTTITDLPIPIESTWIRRIKIYHNSFLNSDKLANKDINTVSEFLDLALELNKQFPDDSAIRYAVKIISQKVLSENDVYAFVIMYLSRICFIYPYFIDVFDDILSKNKPDEKIKKIIMIELNSIMKEHLDFSRSDVALWGIYIAYKHEIIIDDFDKYSDSLIAEKDCLPVLMCYFYSKKNNIDLKKYFNLVTDLKNNFLEDEWWIYIYTLFSEAPNKPMFKTILYKDFYDKIRLAGVQFINVPSANVVVKKKRIDLPF